MPLSTAVDPLAFREALGYLYLVQPNAAFIPHDLYVFVFDGKGRMWANGRLPVIIAAPLQAAMARASC